MLYICRMKISEIKSNPKNPRIIKDAKFAKLVQSIKDFPEMLNVRPLVVNQGNIILGGNMRFKAAKEAGLKDIPVTVVDWSEAKQNEFIIKDNVSGGEWDYEQLANEWNVEELEAWGLDMPDFEVDDIHGDPFDDEGITAQNKFAVVVTCESAIEQEEVFNDLTQKGYKCKILVV